MDELRAYYDMQLYAIVSQIEEIHKATGTEVSLEIINDANEVLSSAYNFDEHIRPDLPCAESSILVMEQQYNRSLGSLNFMLERLKEITKL
jgi:hypothetical protein